MQISLAGMATILIAQLHMCREGSWGQTCTPAGWNELWHLISVYTGHLLTSTARRNLTWPGKALPTFKSQHAGMKAISVFWWKCFRYKWLLCWVIEALELRSHADCQHHNTDSEKVRKKTEQLLFLYIPLLSFHLFCPFFRLRSFLITKLDEKHVYKTFLIHNLFKCIYLEIQKTINNIKQTFP